MSAALPVDAYQVLTDRLFSAVVEWDRRAEKQPGHNRHALGIYCQMLENVNADIARGAEPRAAIVAGFNGRMLDFVLRRLDMATSTAEEQREAGFTGLSPGTRNGGNMSDIMERYDLSDGRAVWIQRIKVPGVRKPTWTVVTTGIGRWDAPDIVETADRDAAYRLLADILKADCLEVEP